MQFFSWMDFLRNVMFAKRLCSARELVLLWKPLCHKSLLVFMPSPTIICQSRATLTLPSCLPPTSGAHTNLILPVRGGSPQPLVHRHRRPLRPQSQAQQDHGEISDWFFFAKLILLLVQVHLGEYDTKDGEEEPLDSQTYKVDHIVIHPDFRWGAPLQTQLQIWFFLIQ